MPVYVAFWEPGLVLHTTGTTRVGTDVETSVTDANSRVHRSKNPWVGGSVPDATASTRCGVNKVPKYRATVSYLYALVFFVGCTCFQGGQGCWVTFRKVRNECPGVFK